MQSRLFARYPILFATFFLAAFAYGADAPNAKVKKDYDALVQQADLANHPERHAQLATWCLNNGWKQQADFHELEYRRYQFAQEKAKLKPNAAAADFKRLLDLAARLKLDSEQAETKPQWLAAELKERHAKLKDGDAAGLKALLVWADKEAGGLGAEDLAREVVKLDAKDELAHLILGHFKDGENWVDPWDLLVKRGGLKDVKVRYEIHKQLDAQRKEAPHAYAKKPLEGLKTYSEQGFTPCWEDPVRGGDGKGMQYIWAPASYDPAKAWPLLVDLHGGGDAPNQPMAWMSMSWYTTHYPKAEFIVICPIARTQAINAWNTQESMLGVIDGIIQTCERFHIDRKRIYLTGASMGGQGTSRFSWVMPELFAAFTPRAGAYWNDYAVPDLAGKSFLVIHGANDEGFRNDSLKVFLDKIHKANADVEYINLPGANHFLPEGEVYPRMFEFFKKHTNDFAPDLRLIRKTVEETVTEKPYKK